MKVEDFKGALVTHLKYINQKEELADNFLSIIRKSASNFFKDDLNIHFFDYHRPTKAMGDEQFVQFKEEVSANPGTHMFIVNWGWHSSGAHGARLETNTFEYLSKFKMCVDYMMEQGINDKCDDEIFLNVFADEKEGAGGIIGSFMYDDYVGAYILYLFCDASHTIVVENNLNMERFFNDVFETVAHSYRLVRTDFIREDVLEQMCAPGKGHDNFISIKERYEQLSINDKEVIEEMLDKVDIANIKNIVHSNVVASHNGAKNKLISNEVIRSWLTNWAMAKKEFYVMFGRNLKVSREINIPLDATLVDSLIRDIKFAFPKYAVILDCFSTNEFIENKVRNRHDNISKYYKEIKPGMKLSKFFTNFFQDDVFDIELSKILQNKDGIKGIISFSIDPYDYLTSSINKHGWNSCHNFINRQDLNSNASAEFMFDESTVISYMCNGKSYDYTDYVKFSGNSKAWRQIVGIGKLKNDIIFERQYPQDYYNDSIFIPARNFIEKVVADFCGIDNNWVIYKTAKGRYIPNNVFVYDDIASFKNNQSYYVRHKYDNTNNDADITKGAGGVFCPICGRKFDRGLNCGPVVCRSCIKN